MTIDKPALKALAVAVELYNEGLEGAPWYSADELQSIMMCDKEDAEFLAAANPAAILALLAENETLALGGSQLRGLFADAAEQCCKAERERDQLKAENEALRRHIERLDADKQAMAEIHVLYTWLRKKCDQPSNDVVAVHMNIGHDWAAVHDLDKDLRSMIDAEEP